MMIYENRNLNWSQEEVDFLCNNYGSMAITSIAMHVKRTPEAVKSKAAKLRLCSPYASSNYILFAHIAKAFTPRKKGGNYTSILKKYIKMGLPVRVANLDKKCRVVNSRAFWDWAKEHKEELDWCYLEKLELGEEPSWVEQLRKNKPKNSIKFWTKAEEERLRSMLKTYRYSYEDLEKEFHRGREAIRRKMERLGIKERPAYRYK